MYSILPDSRPGQKMSNSEFDGNQQSSPAVFQLQQEIDRLREENNSIRNQFNEATTMSEQLEKVHKENIQLIKQVRKANSERDDLQRRLEISLQRNDELKKQNESYPQALFVKNQNQDAHNISFEKERFQWQNERNSFTLKINELNQFLSNEQNKNAELQKNINNILSQSKNYFKRDFSSINDLTAYFAQNAKPACRVGTPRKEHSDISSKASYDSLISKVKKQRNEIRDLKRLYNSSESRAAQYQNDTTKSREEAEAVISELETKITQIQHNFQLQEMKYHHEIQMKDNQIKGLQDSLHDMQIKLNDPNLDLAKNESSSSELNSVKKQLLLYKEKIHEYNKTISQLRHDNSQITSQLSEANVSAETFKKRYSSSEANISSYLSENENLKNSISSLQIENDKLNEQYQTSLTQIQSLESTIKQHETSQLESQSTNEKLESSIKIFEQIIEKQKCDTKSLYEEREQIVSILQKENILLKSYEVFIHRISEENKEIKKNYNSDNFKLNNIQALKHEDSDIPYTSWFCKEFPNDLCSVITETAKNDSLPLTTKLRYILALIAKYYNKKINDIETKQESQSRKLADITKEMDSLLSCIANLSNEGAISFDSIISEPTKIREILKSLEQIRLDHGDKETNSSKMNEIILTIYSKLNANNSEDALNFLDKLINSAFQMKTLIDHLKAKINKKKKEYQSFKSICMGKQREIEDLVNEQQEQYSKIVKERDEMLAKLKQEEDVNQSLKENISNLNSQHKNALDDHEKKCDDAMSSMKSQIDEVKNRYSQELNNKDKQIAEIQAKLHQFEKEIVQWKRTAELLKKSKIEKDNQLLELTSKAQEAERSRQDKLSREKALLKAHFEQLVSQTKSKNDELRKLVMKTSNALEEAQKRNKELVSSCTQLSIEKQQNIAKIEGLKEEIEREHRIMETKIKASALSIELQTQSSIEELKSQFDNEKRDIFGFIANTFRRFFNANAILNEESFKLLIEAVQTELFRMAQQELSIRKILGINQNESIEEHISKLLIDYYHS